MDLYAAWATGKTRDSGLHELVSRVLMSPAFLFHIEEGVRVEGDRVRLTDHEVANRISYALTGSMADEALVQAADNGELKTLNQVAGHVRRLFDTSPTRAGRVKDFFSAWLDVRNVGIPDDNLYRTWAKLPGDPTKASADMQKEIVDFLDAVVLREGDVRRSADQEGLVHEQRHSAGHLRRPRGRRRSALRHPQPRRSAPTPGIPGVE